MQPRGPRGPGLPAWVGGTVWAARSPPPVAAPQRGQLFRVSSASTAGSSAPQCAPGHAPSGLPVNTRQGWHVLGFSPEVTTSLLSKNTHQGGTRAGLRACCFCGTSLSALAPTRAPASIIYYSNSCQVMILRFHLPSRFTRLYSVTQISFSFTPFRCVPTCTRVDSQISI